MSDVFAQRRGQLLSRLGEGSLVILRNAPSHLRNGDVHYPYRPDSNFYYLTGFTEPNAIAVLLQDGSYILFCQPKDALTERWLGPRVDPETACRQFAANEAYPISFFSEKLAHYFLNCRRVFCTMGHDLSFDQKILAQLNQMRAGKRSCVLPDICHLDPYINEMRIKKSPEELVCIERAVAISCRAHRRAMRACRPGLLEYQLEAELMHEFYTQGARAIAYESIVASGKNACVLHYIQNHSELKSGELLLIDAGCEYNYYASDITRTIPINGRFTPEQSALYALVLQTQAEVISLIKPGVAWDVLRDTAANCLTSGLVDLGILRGSVSDLIEQKAYESFYMHGIGHWLGLDVHDAGDYRVQNQWRCLEAGMVLTVEPGIYCSEHIPDVPNPYRNMGIRIEDDVLVTATGHRVLSDALPKQIDEIMAVMSS